MYLLPVLPFLQYFSGLNMCKGQASCRPVIMPRCGPPVGSSLGFLYPRFSPLFSSSFSSALFLRPPRLLVEEVDGVKIFCGELEEDCVFSPAWEMKEELGDEEMRSLHSWNRSSKNCSLGLSTKLDWSSGIPGAAFEGLSLLHGVASSMPAYIFPHLSSLISTVSGLSTCSFLSAIPCWPWLKSCLEIVAFILSSYCCLSLSYRLFGGLEMPRFWSGLRLAEQVSGLGWWRSVASYASVVLESSL